MIRTSPARLLRAVASNAAQSPLPPHHAQVYAALAHGAHSLTNGDIWVLQAMLHLKALSDRQQATLNALSVKVELAR